MIKLTFEKINYDNINEIKYNNIIMFSHADESAMGEPGKIEIISRNKNVIKSYYTNYNQGILSELKDENDKKKEEIILRHILPVLYGEDEDNWYMLHMGFGNWLFVRKEFERDYKLKYHNVPKHEIYSTWIKFTEFVLNENNKEIEEDKKYICENCGCDVEENDKKCPQCKSKFEEDTSLSQTKNLTQCIKTTKKIIEILENKKELYEFSLNGGGGYSYDKDLIDNIFMLLNMDYTSNIYVSNFEKIYKKKKINKYNFEECITFFDYIFHRENIAVGTIMKLMNDGTLLKVAKRLLDILNKRVSQRVDEILTPLGL